MLVTECNAYDIGQTNTIFGWLLSQYILHDVCKLLYLFKLQRHIVKQLWNTDFMLKMYIKLALSTKL